MPRLGRKEEAQCAMCLEALFTKPDDLDEPLKAAALRCGHMYHEECLGQWFKSQTQQWLVEARQYDRLPHEPEPAESDAPITCPTCRAEVFAGDSDEDDAPEVFRLHPTLSEDTSTQAVSSSQRGSSPVRFGPSRKERDKEVILLARKARDYTQQVQRLNEESAESEVNGALVRVDQLNADLSDKAIQAISTHICGLSSAINSLRATLEDNPLSDTMKNDILRLRQQLKTSEDSVRDYKNHVIPREVGRAVEHERKVLEKEIKKTRGQNEVLQRELEKERVARRVQRTAAEARELEHERQTAQLQSQYRAEQKEREDLQDTLNERNKVLRMWQSKHEARKVQEDRIKSLEDENARLKRRVDAAVHPKAGPLTPYEEQDVLADDSIEWLDEHEQPHARLPPRMRSSPLLIADESLQIDLDPFRDDSLRNTLPLVGDGVESRAVATVRSSDKPVRGTARTYAFDLTDDVHRAAKKAKPTLSTSSPDRARSKYFSAQSSSTDASPRVLIPSSSSPSKLDRDHDLVSARPRTHNPFATSKQASDQRKMLKPVAPSSRVGPERSALGANRDIINLADADDTPPKRAASSLGATRSSDGVKQSTLAFDLGLTDRSGRPKKGVVGGERVKRRI